MKPDLPNDAVEMVRAIRDRNYDTTKNMSPDRQIEYEREKIEQFHKCKARVAADVRHFDSTQKT